MISRLAADRGFEFPRVAVSVMKQAGSVVALVEILEDSREDVGLLIRKREAFSLGRGGGSSTGSLEERCLAQDVFVSGKDTPLPTHRQCDDG